MVTPFYGPWSLRARTDESNLVGRFTIQGSDGADGTYQPRPHDPPLLLSIDGAQWAISFEARTDVGEWFDYTMQRSDRFDPQGRLATHFETMPLGDVGGAFAFQVLLVVDLVSLDPTLSPGPVMIPIDITLPGG